MRDSGAIPLIETNTPELCMMIETYNKIIGTTNNPYDLRRTPSGSSGGEVRENHVFLLTCNRLFMKKYFSYKKI
jgi:Asp-tRNAAsn/Glu-tRNAGln amidotransferase A subunit and related amidases